MLSCVCFECVRLNAVTPWIVLFRYADLCVWQSVLSVLDVFGNHSLDCASFLLGFGYRDAFGGILWLSRPLFICVVSLFPFCFCLFWIGVRVMLSLAEAMLIFALFALAFALVIVCFALVAVC